MHIILRNYIPTIGFILWLELRKKRMRQIVRHLFCYCFWMLSANLITVLLFPGGILYREYGSVSIWFLGQKNDFLQYVLPGLLCGMIVTEWYPKARRIFGILCVEVAVTLLLTKPIGLIIICLCILGMELSRKLWSRGYLFRVIVVSPFIMEAALFIIARGYNRKTLLYRLLSMLPSSGVEKNITVGYRFNMWNFVLSPLNPNLLIGMGALEENSFKAASGLNFFHTHMHNMHIDAIYTGGLLSLAVFLLWQSGIVEKLCENRGSLIITRIAEFYVGVSMIFITECPYLPSIIFCYTLVYWHKYLLSTLPLGFTRSGTMNAYNSRKKLTIYIYIYCGDCCHFRHYHYAILRLNYHRLKPVEL